MVSDGQYREANIIFAARTLCLGDVADGSIARFCHVFCMSGLPPIASEIAAKKFSHWERILKGVGSGSDHCQAASATF
jgi:hypothetical protein